MIGSYNYYLVALSVLVAMLASFTVLEFTGRIKVLAYQGVRRVRWLLGGATVMGIGVWSMHFIGMLSYQMPMQPGYSLTITALSLMIAIGCSYFALHTATKPLLTQSLLLWSGFLMGVGIAAMHYVGMCGMQLSDRLRYKPIPFCLSIAVAMIASWTSLWIASSLWDGERDHVGKKRAAASVLMGVAISGMHYIGICAAIFPPMGQAAPGSGTGAVWIALALAVGTILLLSAALFWSKFETRLDSEAHLILESLEEANRRLITLSQQDLLTELPNRAFLMERMAETIATSKLDGRSFTLMFMDLDGFKTINDSLGHAAGDSLLIEFSGHLRRSLRRDDMVARLGGDEFVILLANLGLQQDITPIAMGILGRMQQDFLVAGTPLRVTLSMGMATYPQDGTNPEELLKNADMAMYEAKGNGKNTFRFFDSAMSEAAARTLQIYRGLNQALGANELSMHFQPKFGGSRCDLVGAEALIRWHHPTMGNVPPMEFIPIAEQTGQMMRIGSWVISEVCRQIREWDRLDIPCVKIAINLSPEQLRIPNYVENVQEIIDAAGICADRIMFEITETVAMKDAALSVNVISQFHEAGFDIGIDDFGTGYSSLAYLQQFRVKQLKIDRFFTGGLDVHGAEGLAIVSAIIAMAHSLNMVVVAEGVETGSQLSMLQELNCDEVQGFLLGRPLNAENFGKLLATHRDALRISCMEIPVAY
jgi:diguanylate cyclase (GGDEF)-like protein